MNAVSQTRTRCRCKIFLKYVTSVSCPGSFIVTSVFCGGCFFSHSALSAAPPAAPPAEQASAHTSAADEALFGALKITKGMANDLDVSPLLLAETNALGRRLRTLKPPEVWEELNFLFDFPKQRSFHCLKHVWSRGGVPAPQWLQLRPSRRR